MKTVGVLSGVIDPILVDESLEQLDPSTIQAGDVVGISVHTGNALRGYEVGRICKERGATVVYGGIHATLFPEEPFERGYADAVVKGDGDVAWGQVLLDLELGRAKRIYEGGKLEREKDIPRYGEWPYEIGLWVGKAATPNILGRKGDGRSDSARTKVRQFKADPKGKPSPIPLEECPWCGTRFGSNSFALLPNDDQPRELRIVCTNFECDFTRDRPLPIVAVDEPIYRRLPAFLIATVDKFASLPWVGQTGTLLGGAERHDAAGFYGPSEPGKGMRLAAPLPPP